MKRVRSHAAFTLRAYSHHTRAPRPTRLSTFFLPTYSADAASVQDSLESLQWLLRGGYIRQSASGTFSYLPVGLRMLQKITAVIDEEMEAVCRTCTNVDPRLTYRNAADFVVDIVAQDGTCPCYGQRGKLEVGTHLSSSSD